MIAFLAPPFSLSNKVRLFSQSIQISMAANNDLLSHHIKRLKSSPTQTLLLDGGTGEELFLNGVPDDRKIWSATAIVHEKYHPTLEKVHRSFIEAGSQAITTNSYGIIPGAGFTDGEEVKRLTGIAGQIGRRAVTNSDGTVSALILGSLGPLVESYRADLIMKHEDGVRCYQYAIEGLNPFVDVYLGETISCIEEACQIVDALSTFYVKGGAILKQPLLISFTLSENGKLRGGESVVDAIQNMVNYSEEKKVELIGILFNCCEPESITLALEEVKACSKIHQYLHHPPGATSSEQCSSTSKIFLGAYANKLTAVDPNWTMTTSTGPQAMREDLPPDGYWKFVNSWNDGDGVQLVGGCCGIGPAHISYLKKNMLLTHD